MPEISKFIFKKMNIQKKWVGNIHQGRTFEISIFSLQNLFKNRKFVRKIDSSNFGVIAD